VTAILPRIPGNLIAAPWSPPTRACASSAIAEAWYQLHFEAGGGRTITPGDVRPLRLERIIVLKRRAMP